MTDTAIDLVYPLGRGSKWQDNELRYSLRSVAKYCPWAGRVHVLTDKLPHWLDPKTVVHWPLPDPFTKGGDKKIRNTTYKLLEFAKYFSQPTFCLMHDDFFFGATCDPHLFGPHETFCSGDLEDAIKDRSNRHADSYYLKAMTDTYQYLNDRGHSCFNYSIHCPMIFHTVQLMHILDRIMASNKALLWRTIYGNMLEVAPIARLDPRIDNEYQLYPHPFFSIGPHMPRLAGTRQFLQDQYPLPSVHERPNPKGYSAPTGSALARLLRLGIK